MNLRKCKLYKLHTLKELQELLNINLKGLPLYSNKAILHHHYRVYIKQGRIFEEPISSLKTIQSKIHLLLSEIELPDYYKSAKGHNSTEGAAIHGSHTGSLIKLDISKFFPSTARDKVYKFWLNDMKVSASIANILTNLTTISIIDTPKYKEAITFLDTHKIKTHNHLPTGAPTSPLLSYLCNYKMFDDIEEIVKQHDGLLTVYADDITISNVSNTRNVFLDCRSILFNNGYLTSKNKSHYWKSVKGKEINGVIINSSGKKCMPNRLHKKINDMKQASLTDYSPNIKGLHAYRKQIEKLNC